jgi:hypothetical protein
MRLRKILIIERKGAHEIETLMEPHRQDHSFGKTTWHVAYSEVLLLLLRTEEKTAHALAKCNPTTRC